MTPQFTDLGEWIRFKFGDAGQGGLAAKLKPPVSKNAVSMWKTGKNRISPAYEKQIRALGYDGPLPEVGGEVTKADIESLREEIRTQAAWVREEIRKENTALAADLREALKLLGALQGTPPEAPA